MTSVEETKTVFYVPLKKDFFGQNDGSQVIYLLQSLSRIILIIMIMFRPPDAQKTENRFTQLYKRCYLQKQ